MDLPRINASCDRSDRNCLGRCWRRRLVTVEPVVFLYMFASFLYLIIFELYSFNEYGRDELKAHGFNISEENASNVYSRGISQYHCLSTKYLDEHSITNKSGDEAQKKTALLNLMVGGAAQLPSVLACLLLGTLSDRFGRKPALFVIVTGAVFQATLTTLIIHFQFSLYLFIVGSATKATTGGIASLLTASHAYIADISSRKWLTLRLGIVEASTFIAGMLSFVVGGVWVQLSGCDFRAPSYLLVASAVAVVIYVVLFVPESLSRHESSTQRDQKKPKVIISPRAFLRGFRIFFAPSRSRWKLLFTLFSLIVTILNMTGTMVIITLFLLHKPLAWDPSMIGVYLAASELVHGLMLMFFLPIMVALEMPDAGIALVGICISCIMDISLGLVAYTWEMFLVGMFQGLDAVVIPSLKALMSKTVRPEDQGALFSFVTAVQVLVSSAAAALYAFVYSHTLSAGWGAGTPFFLMGLLYVLSVPFMGAVLVAHIRKRRGQPRRPRIRIISSPFPDPSSSGHPGRAHSINYCTSDFDSTRDVGESQGLITSPEHCTDYGALRYESSS